jgi:hypothetical protein
MRGLGVFLCSLQMFTGLQCKDIGKFINLHWDTSLNVFALQCSCSYIVLRCQGAVIIFLINNNTGLDGMCYSPYGKGALAMFTITGFAHDPQFQKPDFCSIYFIVF